MRALAQIGMNEFVFNVSFDSSLNHIDFVFRNDKLTLQERVITNSKKFLEFEIKPHVQIHNIEFYDSIEFQESIDSMTIGILIAKQLLWQFSKTIEISSSV